MQIVHLIEPLTRDVSVCHSALTTKPPLTTEVQIIDGLKSTYKI
jgi:hypothetical protein